MDSHKNTLLFCWFLDKGMTTTYCVMFWLFLALSVDSHLLPTVLFLHHLSTSQSPSLNHHNIYFPWNVFISHYFHCQTTYFSTSSLSHCSSRDSGIMNINSGNYYFHRQNCLAPKVSTPSDNFVLTYYYSSQQF